MRFFVPTFELGSRLGPQAATLDKVGGAPFGIAAEAWPRCAECGGTMSHIAQLLHDSDRLDLGRRGRVLTVWQCEHDPGMCESWSPAAGANAAIVSDAPDADAGPVNPPDSDTVVYPEVRVTEWVQGDDGVTEDLLPAFFGDESYAALDARWSAEERFTTRLGVVPTWIQSAEEGPGPPWSFVGQIADSQTVSGEVPSADETGFGIQRRVVDRFEMQLPTGIDASSVKHWIVVDEAGWYVSGPNFGDGGMAYLFLNRTTDPPAARIFWQCS